MIRRNSLIATGNEGVKGFLVSDVGDDNRKCLSDVLVKRLDRKFIPINDFNQDWDSLFDRLVVENIKLTSYELSLRSQPNENDNVKWWLVVKIQPQLEIMSSYGRAEYNMESIHFQVLLYNNGKRKIVGYCSTTAVYRKYKVTEWRCEEIINHVFKKLFKEETEHRTK